MQKAVIAGVGVAVSLVMIGCAGLKSADEPENDDPEAQVEQETKKKVKFLTEVKPLLENYCLRCHNTGLLLGDLNLETRKLAFAPGEGGPFIIPKHPEASKLYQVLELKTGEREAMPPEKHRMTKDERDVIFRWIKQGADWPKDSRGTLMPVLDSPTVVMLGEAR